MVLGMRSMVLILYCLHFTVNESSAAIANFTLTDTDKLKKFTQNLMECRRIPGKPNYL